MAEKQQPANRLACLTLFVLTSEKNEKSIIFSERNLSSPIVKNNKVESVFLLQNLFSAKPSITYTV